MTALIDIDNFRFYLGQSPNEHVYDSSFDLTKHEATADIKGWKLVRDHETGDTVDIKLSNADGRYSTDYPVSFGHGVEIKYITSGGNIETADATTNWAETGTGFTGPTIENDLHKQGTGCVKYTIGGVATGPGDSIDVTNLSKSLVGGDEVELWLKTSTAVAAGDIDLKLYKTVVGYVLVDTIVNINAVPADEWTRVRFEAIDSLTPGFTLTKIEIFGDGVWQNDTIYLDQIYGINEIKWVFKGEMAPVNLRSSPRNNDIKVEARGIGRFTLNGIVSRDYLITEWDYAEDVIYDIVYNLSNLFSAYAIEAYMIDGVTKIEDGLGPDKHSLVTDVRLRNLTLRDTINVVCTQSRIGYYLHTDVDDGTLRLTLKDRSTTTVDYTIEASDFEVGMVSLNQTNEDAVSKVVVVGKDGVTASQTNRRLIDEGYTNTKVVSDNGAKTVKECANRAHFEIIRSSPDDDIVRVTLNQAGGAYQDGLLFTEPYDVVDITDADVGLDQAKYNLVNISIGMGTSISIEWTLGEIYKEYWLRYYDAINNDFNEETPNPITYRMATSGITVSAALFTNETVGGTCTLTDAGKLEIAECFTKAFYRFNTAQRFQRCYAVNDGGTIQLNTGQVYQDIWFTFNDTNKSMTLYLPFDWDNNTGSQETIDYFYPVVTEVTELVEDVASGGTSLRLRRADGAVANKQFDIAYRNSSKVIYSDAIQSVFAVEHGDYDIFQTNDDLTIQFPDGTTGTATITMDADSQVITVSSGDQPTVGSTVFYEDDETCTVSSIVWGDDYDTVTITAGVSRSIQSGAKIEKYFTPAVTHAQALGIDVANGTTLRVFLALTLTSDTSTTDYNSSYVTKEGLAFLANQLIGDTTNSFRRQYKSQQLYSAIGTDNTTALAYDWKSNYEITMGLASAWIGSSLTVNTYTGSVTSIPTGQTAANKIVDSVLTGDWEKCELVFTSTNNNGVRRLITDITGTTITLDGALPDYPASGDAFYIEYPVEVGDFVFSDDGAVFTGVSGTSETKAAFLKVVSFTGGPPRTTIQLEDTQNLAASPATSVTLIGNEMLAAEINRNSASAVVVSPSYDINKYSIKLVSEFDDLGIGPETSSGLATGRLLEVQEIGIFTESSNVESALQYYLDDVAFDGRTVQLGYGDDPYDNLNAHSLMSAVNGLPRSDSFVGAYNLSDVRGFRHTDIRAPVRIWFGVASTLNLSTGPISILGFGLGYIDITDIGNFENDLLTYDNDRFYNSDSDLVDRRNKYGAAASEEAATWATPDRPYVIHEFIFKLPDDTDPDQLKSLTFNWAGSSNRPMTAYVHINVDRIRNPNVAKWRQFDLESGFGINSSVIESVDSGEKYFSGAGSFHENLWQLINYQGFIYIIVVAADPDHAGNSLSYLMTDVAHISYVIEGTSFGLGKGRFRKGVDYYYDISTPNYLWWDYVDPIRLLTYSYEQAYISTNNTVSIPVPSIIGFQIGMKLFLEDDNGDIVSSRVVSVNENTIDVAPSFVNPGVFSGDNAIYIVQFNPNEKVMVNGKEYVKQLPGKTQGSDTYGGFSGSDSVLVHEGFEGGVDGETVTSAYTALSEVLGSPLFEESTAAVGALSCRIITNGNYISVEADTSNVSYLTANALIYIVTGSSSADNQVLLLDSSNNICAGVRFYHTGGERRVYWYSGDGWNYSDGAFGYNFQWSYDTYYQVQIIFEMSSGEYQFSLNGVTVNDDPEVALPLPKNTNIVPVKLRLLNNSGTDTFDVDEIYLGRGHCSEFEFPEEVAASLSESSFRKRGFGQYLPTELKVVDKELTRTYVNSSVYEDVKVVKESIIENVGDGKIHLSIVEDMFWLGSGFLKNGVHASTSKKPLNPSIGNTNVSYGVKADITNMRLYRSTTIIGEGHYGGTPGYGTPNPTVQIITKVSRHCKFTIYADGNAGSNAIIEVWSREGNPIFGYLSGMVYQEGAGDQWKTVYDEGSGVFPLEHASVGCVNLYEQNLSPGATDKMAEVWDDPVYDLETGDDYIIFDEEYQQIAGVPRVQANMQFSVSNHVASPADPDPRPIPTGNVEHFLIRKVESWPRHSSEKWTGVTAKGYTPGDNNIMADWMWATSETGSGAVTTETGSGYRSLGRAVMTTTASASDLAEITHTTRLASGQSFRCYVRGSTDANGYIRFSDETNALFEVTFDDGDIKIGAVTLDAFPDSTTYMEIIVEIDSNGEQGKVWSREVGNAGTEVDSDYIAWSTTGSVVRKIDIASDGVVGNGTVLYIGACDIYGGDRSDPKLYAHLTHTTDANKRFSTDYDVSLTSFRLWKWMHNRATFSPIWVNLHTGLKQSHEADLNMVYERGANYSVEYLRAHGLCLTRSLLQDSSQDHPIRLRPKERLHLTQEIVVEFE